MRAVETKLVTSRTPGRGLQPRYGDSSMATPAFSLPSLWRLRPPLIGFRVGDSGLRSPAFAHRLLRPPLTVLGIVVRSYAATTLPAAGGRGLRIAQHIHARKNLFDFLGSFRQSELPCGERRVVADENCIRGALWPAQARKPVGRAGGGRVERATGPVVARRGRNDEFA